MDVLTRCSRTLGGITGSLVWRGLVVAFLFPGWSAPAAQQSNAGLEERPLAAPSGPRSATMFAALDPAATGVVTENRYADPAMWGERFPEYFLGSMGTGVAIGDYDADGRPDLFVVSKTEECRLFRNLGDWKFADVTVSAGISAPASSWTDTVKSWFSLGSERSEDAVGFWKQGATFADVDNDGWLDVYLCRIGAPNWLFINQGDGTFTEEAAARGLAITDASCMGAFCDFDRDGWLDVYVQTNLLDASVQPAGQRDYLLRNRGDGTFVDVTTTAGISGENLAHSATWWDFNEDGWPDLHVANDFGPPDRLYRNNGDGTFRDVIHEVAPMVPYSSMGADLGDVNNDGRLDLLTTDMAATSHEKDQRGMVDSRPGNPEHLPGSALIPQSPRNMLFLNSGTGRLLEAAQLAGIAATDWTWSVRFEDFDNDGRVDLHVTNGMNREHHNIDLRERIYISENPADRIRIMRDTPVLAETNLGLRNDGDLRFTAMGAEWGLDDRGVSFGTATGDFDGDGDLDLAYSNYEAGLKLLRNDSATGHRVIIALRGTTSNRHGVGATVHLESASGVQVRSLVLARGYLSSSEPVLHFGLGDDVRVDRLTITWPTGNKQTLLDLPVDRHFTITEPAATANERPASPSDTLVKGQFREVSAAAGLALTVAEGSSEETSLQSLPSVRFSRRGPAVAIADLDGDDWDDVFVAGSTETSAQIARADTRGRFSLVTLASDRRPRLDDGPAVLFDVDGDGSIDIFQTRTGASLPAGAPDYQPQLWLNDGRGDFRPAPANALPALPLSAGAAVAADFNRDGQLDLFVGARVLPGRYPVAPRSALLLNRGGTFEDATDTLAPGLREIGMVTAALWTDVDGDGWVDLLLALEWGGVRCFRNEAGTKFEDWSERLGFSAAGRGWWTSLAAADFNGDEQPDYVAGNVGLNTRYQATGDEPAVLLAGDVKGDATWACIEAHYENERLFPSRSRKELGALLPAVVRRFPKNDAFARATVEEILGQDRVAKLRRFSATEFSSGVFLSGSNGRYRFVALPRLAQIAPLQGIAAGDFDGDGRADIYALQNSRSWTTERFEGGISQLLQGDGRGGFTCVPSTDSGLVVPGDAKALAVLDLEADGWPDFLASRNDQPALVYRNFGVPGRLSLRVVLHGPAGNPRAVGARVTAEHADGATQTSEVYAGSSSYSQSSADCFFGAAPENPLRLVRVRWPAGGTTSHPVDTATGTMTITAAKP